MHDKIEKCSVSSNASKHFLCNYCYVVLDGKNIFGCFRYSSSSLAYKQVRVKHPVHDDMLSISQNRTKGFGMCFLMKHRIVARVIETRVSSR